MLINIHHQKDLLLLKIYPTNIHETAYKTIDTIINTVILDMKYPNAFKWFKNNPAVESFESEADLINEEYYAEEEYE